jgi:hypothetical protein
VKRLAIAYLAGAASITGFVLATGGHTLTLFALGFFAALAFVAIVGRFLGAERVIEIIARLSTPSGRRRRQVELTGRKTAPVAMPSSVEREVASALVNLGTPGRRAQQLAAAAAASSPDDFEAMFRTAISLSNRKSA